MQPDRAVVVGSIQKLSRPENVARIAAERFDYVVVDEVHHADAPTYRFERAAQVEPAVRAPPQLARAVNARDDASPSGAIPQQLTKLPRSGFVQSGKYAKQRATFRSRQRHPDSQREPCVHCRNDDWSKPRSAPTTGFSSLRGAGRN
jgi:hypothetical protein